MKLHIPTPLRNALLVCVSVTSVSSAFIAELGYSAFEDIRPSWVDEVPAQTGASYDIKSNSDLPSYSYIVPVGSVLVDASGNRYVVQGEVTIDKTFKVTASNDPTISRYRTFENVIIDPEGENVTIYGETSAADLIGESNNHYISNISTSFNGGADGRDYGDAETKVYITQVPGGVIGLGHLSGGNTNLDNDYDHSANFTGDVFIKLDGEYISNSNSSYSFIVGGNKIDLTENTSANYSATFTGDTNIYINNTYGQVVDRIVGGNYIESYADSVGNVSFYGNTSIVVESYISGGIGSDYIVGGNMGSSKESIFSGNTEIVLKEGFMGLTLVGASYLTSIAEKATFIGNTSVSVNGGITAIDYEEYYGAGYYSFDSIARGRGVTGGFNQNEPYIVSSYQSSTATAELLGNTNVLITNENPYKATYQQSIVGGSLVTYGLNVTQKVTSDAGIVDTSKGIATLTITGVGESEFTNSIVGGNASIDVFYTKPDETLSNIMHITTQEIYKSVLNIDSGVYTNQLGLETSYKNGVVVAGSLSIANGGRVSNDKSELNVSGGSFDTLVAGNAALPGHVAAKGDGIGYMHRQFFTTSGALYLGDSKLNITNGSSTLLVGGNYIDGGITEIRKSYDTTASVYILDSLAATLDNVDADITGGEHGVIVGGSYVGQGIAQATIDDGSGGTTGYAVTQKSIDLSLKGDTTVSGGLVAAAGLIDIDGTGTKDLALKISTEATRVELDNQVSFTQKTTVSGGYGVTVDNVVLDDTGVTHQGEITGNRDLVFADGVYENLNNVTFKDFDQMNIGAGSSVDFAASQQDLDHLNGRYSYTAATDTTAASYQLDTAHVSNTALKTGEGTLKLGAVNGQHLKTDELGLVVAEGEVVLAASSSDINTQTNFENFTVMSGATLNMSEANAGINGHLRLDMSSILIADASRAAAGSGTMLESGSLVLENEIVLTLQNIDQIVYQAATSTQVTLPSGDHLRTAGEAYFEIVLFSGLDYTDIMNVNMSFEEDVLDGMDIRYTLANSYFAEGTNFLYDVLDLYFVWKDNGDFVLTASTSELPMIPEPSTATLSVLALAGLLARRRRRI